MMALYFGESLGTFEAIQARMPPLRPTISPSGPKRRQLSTWHSRARTVNVTSQTDSSVTFAFGDQDGLAREFFVVQWINTGVAPAAGWTVDFRFGDPAYAEGTAFFGRGWDFKRYLLCQQSNKFRFYGENGSVDVGGLPKAGVNYRCVIDPSYTEFSNVSSVRTLTGDDGTESRSTIKRSVAGSGNFAIFGISGGTRLTTFTFYRMRIGTRAANNANTAKFRFDSMIVKDGAVVVRDLVPVQTTDGRGALFDRANGRVFENATDTDFTQGEAVERQGWEVATTESLQGFSVRNMVIIIR